MAINFVELKDDLRRLLDRHVQQALEGETARSGESVKNLCHPVTTAFAVSSTYQQVLAYAAQVLVETGFERGKRAGQMEPKS